MEINKGDYVRYRGNVYSVVDWSTFSGNVDLISYKDLEILRNIPKSELEKLTDFHVSAMRYNKELPKRRFKVGDNVKLRVNLDSTCFYGCTFSRMGFSLEGSHTVSDVYYSCCLYINNCNIHEFEIELVEGS